MKRPPCHLACGKCCDAPVPSIGQDPVSDLPVAKLQVQRAKRDCPSRSPDSLFVTAQDPSDSAAHRTIHEAIQSLASSSDPNPRMCQYWICGSEKARRTSGASDVSHGRKVRFDTLRKVGWPASRMWPAGTTEGTRRGTSSGYATRTQRVRVGPTNGCRFAGPSTRRSPEQDPAPSGRTL
jgi:hypothetical protein